MVLVGAAGLLLLPGPLRKIGGWPPRHRTIRVLAGCCVVFFVLGLLDMRLSGRNLEKGSQDLVELATTPERHVLTAQVVRCPIPAENGTSLLAAVRERHTALGGSAISGLISLSVEGVFAQDIHPGDWIRFSASLRPVRNFQTPGTFDLENWWALRGVRVKGFVGSPLRFAVVGHSRGSDAMSLPRYWLEAGREALINALGRCLEGQALGVGLALLVGERAWLSQEVSKAFSSTGTGHLLAVSGIHMALAALFIGGMVRAVLLRCTWITLRMPVRKVATFAAMLAAIAYAGLAGFSPSAVRAMVMILAFGSAFLVDRSQTPLNSLALAAWCILLFEPLNLFSISFQLSFSAVFFLILFSPHFGWKNTEEDPEGRFAFRARLRALLLVTVVAGIATAPLTAWHFQRLSLLAVPCNLVMVPFTSLFILPCLLAGAVLSIFSAGAASVVWGLAGAALEPVLRLTAAISQWEWSALWVARPSMPQILLCYSLLGLLAFVQKDKGFRWGSGVLLLLLVCVTVYGRWAVSRTDDVAIHVLDVGQGACQVIELPGGGLMVVDGGGLRGSQFDVGERVVAPFIRSLGYTGIDVIVVSHPEQDHVGGLAALALQFPTGEIWTNGDGSEAPAWSRLMEACSLRGVQHRIWTERGQVRMGGVEVEIVPPGACHHASGRNARSLALLFRHGRCTALLPGDIDSGRERCLILDGLGSLDVLVVPHHGSGTSSSREFVAGTRPRFGIVPVGWRNQLGLPRPEVLERYRRAGVRVLRTDFDGTVSITMDGETTCIKTYRNGRTEAESV
jgi:competence protein ComEC